jgi:hypothetical protein
MKRKTDVFGPFADYIRQQPCLVCGRRPSEPHHIRSRGAGGTDIEGFGSHGNLVPLCGPFGCHAEGHQGGWQTFQKNHGVDLRSAAENYYRHWVG